MELLYRALNEKDEQMYKLNKTITCSILNQPSKQTSKRIEYLKLFNTSLKYILATTYSHINGQEIKSQTSPFISTSKNLKFVIEEYAMPQNGNYNSSSVRRPVVVLKYDKIGNYIKTNDKFKALENNECWNLSSVSQMMIDFNTSNFEKNLCHTDSEGNIHGTIMPKKYIVEMCTNILDGTFILKKENFSLDCKGLNNFATKAEEVLIYKQIDSNNILGILEPLFQDIIYNYPNIDLERLFQNKNKYVNCIKSMNLEEQYKTLFNMLYTDNLNLTEIAYNSKSIGLNNNYNNALIFKKNLLKKIINKLCEIDSSLFPKIEAISIPDEKVFTAEKIDNYFELNNGEKITNSKNKLINDVLITVDNNKEKLDIKKDLLNKKLVKK